MQMLNIIMRRGTLLFFIISAVVVCAFLYFSSLLVHDLSEQERQRMQIWADATRQVANVGMGDEASTADLDFLLGIIEGNTNIPVLLTDQEGNIIMHRNFDLPEPSDPHSPLFISEKNEQFLARKLNQLKHDGNVIDITIDPGNVQHLYYEDSRLLRNLSLYPYIQLAVMAAFILVVYLAVSSQKRAEQNKVWVGLSKETAHQLGTPISSLMAWIELLDGMGVDHDVVKEMDKDVQRLSDIAGRFSKIGSQPAMEPANLNDVVSRSSDYMRTRISSRVHLSANLCQEPLPVSLSAPLVAWVMENLIKNAVDAMEGSGVLTIETFTTPSHAVIEVTDTGKGIARKNFKNVFSPGFTTKSRGWGLGLTLARRIIEQYHRGHINIKWSEPGKGTTFRLEFPLRREDAEA